MRMLKMLAVLICAALVSACGSAGDIRKAGDLLATTAPALAEVAGGDQSAVARGVLEVNGLVQGTRQAVTLGCAMVLTGTDDGPSVFDRVLDPMTRYCAERAAVLSGTIQKQAGRIWGASGLMFALSSMKTNQNRVFWSRAPD